MAKQKLNVPPYPRFATTVRVTNRALARASDPVPQQYPGTPMGPPPEDRNRVEKRQRPGFVPSSVTGMWNTPRVDPGIVGPQSVRRILVEAGDVVEPSPPSTDWKDLAVGPRLSDFWRAGGGQWRPDISSMVRKVFFGDPSPFASKGRSADPMVADTALLSQAQLERRMRPPKRFPNRYTQWPQADPTQDWRPFGRRRKPLPWE